MDIKRINTIGELKESGYQPKNIKEEIRRNLIKKTTEQARNFQWHHRI